MLGFIEILRNELFETEGPPNRAVFSLVSKNLISCFFLNPLLAFVSEEQRKII
jgi:hypothetical protein